MPEEEFRVWLAQDAPGLEGPGAVVLMERQGCLMCHSIDGTFDQGPTFKGLFGSRLTVLRGEQEVELEADEEYLRRAILRPEAELVKGFHWDMPPPEDLSEEDLQQIIEYLKTLRDGEGTGNSGVTGDRGGGGP